jgi:beta-N-acetylhexosaminidase
MKKKGFLKDKFLLDEDEADYEDLEGDVQEPEEESEDQDEDTEDSETVVPDEEDVEEKSDDVEDEDSEDDDEESDEDYEDEEDEEDDEDDEEDEDEEDAEYEAYIRSPEYKRERRRKRRMRNQLLAFLSLFIIIALIGVLIFVLGAKVFHATADKRQAAQIAAELESVQQEETVVISEPETTVETEELNPIDEIAEAAIAEMPIEDKVSALFMVSPSQLTGVASVTQVGDTSRKALDQYKVGGLVYDKSNVKDTQQLTKLLADTAAERQNIFLAASELGGDQSVIAKTLKKEATASFADLGAAGDTAAANTAGFTTGSYLAELGFNLNLAPVTDLQIGDGNLLGSTTFGSDASQVGAMAAEYVKGLQASGVSACVRTFPGLGAVTGGSEGGMMITERTKEEMTASEFVAYKAAIDAGAEFVMVSTASAPNLTDDNTPCCMSASAIHVLRSELGFDGIVMTDAMNTGTITEYYDIDQAVVKAINAGVDMIYMPSDFEAAYNGVLTAVQNGDISEERLHEALLHIYRVKYKNKVS